MGRPGEDGGDRRPHIAPRRLDLGTADLLGADLRNADLRGADLSRSLFLTQPQVTAARGDASTRLPSVLQRPVHWDGR